MNKGFKITITILTIMLALFFFSWVVVKNLEIRNMAEGGYLIELTPQFRLCLNIMLVGFVAALEFMVIFIILKTWKRKRPKIVCLCGSTRFGEAFRKAQLDETLAGKIVLTIGCNMKSDADIFGHLSETELTHIKAMLDELHKRKIDLADEILVLNVGGYIGESTRSEIEYAEEHDKPIRYFEAIKK